MRSPSLTALREFDAAHSGGPASLGDVGLMLIDPPERNWCEDTPNNGRIFATTGGDWVHFCLLELAGRPLEESPVVMVLPFNSDAPCLVVGETLHEFLSLGCVIGYFFLEQLVYRFNATLEYLFDYDAFIQDCYSHQKPPDSDVPRLAAERALLASLSREFGLSPWADLRSRLDTLQRKWAGHFGRDVKPGRS
jgi:hypothetical protein